MVATMSDQVRERLVGMIKHALSDPSVELEARLGVCRDGRFEPGVTREHMDELVRCLDACGDVATQGHGWTENEDYMFELNAQRCRTRVTYDPERLCIDTKTITKCVIDSITISTRVLDVRIALAQEHAAQDVPVAVEPSMVRIKQSKAYTVARSPFRFDCSLVWSGTSRSAAESMQRDGLPAYEVECEFIPHAHAAWRQRYSRGDKCAHNALATSMSYKIADIMLGPGIHLDVTR